jgi:hypothetical protein
VHLDLHVEERRRPGRNGLIRGDALGGGADANLAKVLDCQSWPSERGLTPATAD